MNEYYDTPVFDLLITEMSSYHHKNHQNYVKISFQRSKSKVTFIKNDDKLPFSMVFIGFYPTMIIISKLQNPY